MTRFAVLAALLVPLSIACRPAIAASHGTATCRPADTYGVNLLAYVTEIATGDEFDSGAARHAYRLKATAGESIALVSDETLCQRAAIAFREAMLGKDQGRPIRVYVVRAGNAYVVTDPEHRTTISLDSSFARNN